MEGLIKIEITKTTPQFSNDLLTSIASQLNYRLKN